MQPPPPPPMPSGSLPVYYPAVNIAYGGPQYRSPQSTYSVFSLNVAHNLTQLCLGGVVVSSLVTASSVNWLLPVISNHITLCTIGYFILMAQAILSFSPVGWANNLKGEHKRLIHASLQVIGSILALTGCALQFIDRKLQLSTAHGICGFIAMIFTIVSAIAGVFNFMFSQTPNNKYFKILHSSLGTVTMIVAFISLIFGFHDYYRILAGNANANFAIVLSVFAIIGTLVMACVNNFKRILGHDKVTDNMS